MSLKINPPDLSKSKSYENYKIKYKLGKKLLISKRKNRELLLYSLPDDHEKGIRNKVFGELSLNELKADDGLGKLIMHLDKILGEDDLADSFQKYEDFEDCKRQSNQAMDDYIIEFDQKHNKLIHLNIRIPAEIVAFKMIKSAMSTKQERLVVLNWSRL